MKNSLFVLSSFLAACFLPFFLGLHSPSIVLAPFTDPQYSTPSSPSDVSYTHPYSYFLHPFTTFHASQLVTVLSLIAVHSSFCSHNLMHNFSPSVFVCACVCEGKQKCDQEMLTYNNSILRGNDSTRPRMGCSIPKPTRLEEERSKGSGTAFLRDACLRSGWGPDGGVDTSLAVCATTIVDLC